MTETTTKSNAVGRLLDRFVRRVFMSFWMKHFLSKYQWYRRWHGGRWENHWIDICGSFIWLDMRKDRCWPEYRQPCSFVTPIIEDYPERPTPNASLEGRGTVKPEQSAERSPRPSRSDC